MFTTAVLLFIAIFDFLRHRIPNIAIIVLIFSIIVNGEISIRLNYAYVVLAIALLGYWKFNLGAGDVKLAFIIALFLTPSSRIIDYWLTFSLIGCDLSFLKWSTTRSLKGNIALAPALCGAVLCISTLTRN
jgi:Flp pilus assembly protein protease CpaA